MNKMILSAALMGVASSQAAFDIYSALQTKNYMPVVVLGAGPAGYAAAMETTRAGLPTLILTGPVIGGQLMGTSAVENFPGIKKVEGHVIPETMHEQALEFGAKILEDTAVSVELNNWPFVIKTENGQTIHACALIITTGATPKKLGVPGEEIYWGKGVSSCAYCDCMFYKDMDVFIVGGGDAAIEEALQLSTHAKKITILVRSNRMRAVNHMKDKLVDYPHIDIVYNKQVIEVLGDDKTVTGLRLKDSETGEISSVKTDGLFLAIGHSPNTELFKGQLELMLSGHIVCEGRTQATSVRGVFAAGDVEDAEIRQAPYSVGLGCRAGREASSWIKHELGISDLMIMRTKENMFYSEPIYKA